MSSLGEFKRLQRRNMKFNWWLIDAVKLISWGADPHEELQQQFEWQHGPSLALILLSGPPFPLACNLPLMLTKYVLCFRWLFCKALLFAYLRHLEKKQLKMIPLIPQSFVTWFFSLSLWQQRAVDRPLTGLSNLFARGDLWFAGNGFACAHWGHMHESMLHGPHFM